MMKGLRREQGDGRRAAGGRTAERQKERRDSVERAGRQRGDSVALRSGIGLRTPVVLVLTLLGAAVVGYGLGLANVLDSIPHAQAFLSAHLRSFLTAHPQPSPTAQATPDVVLAILICFAWFSSLSALWRRLTAGIVLLDLGLSLGTVGAAALQLLAGIVTLKIGLTAERPILIVAAESLVLFAVASLLTGRTQVREKAVVVGLWHVYPWRRIIAYDLNVASVPSRLGYVPVIVTVARRRWSMFSPGGVVLRCRQVQRDKLAALLTYRVRASSSPRRSA